MTLQLKRFALLIALTLPLTQIGYAQDEDADAEQEEQSEEAAEQAVTDYISMDPPFVTHVGKPGTSLMYLKAAITLRASTSTARAALENHMPRLRHEMVMLFGEQTDVDALSSNAGQSQVREEAKKRINAVLEEQQTGEQVSDVLFTEFVVQR